VPRVKLFSIDQAEKALPLVKRVVTDIVRTFKDREKAIDARRALPLTPPPASAAEESALKLERDIESLEAEIVRYHAELTEIGVEMKDFRLGLIDFYSRFEDRIVYLCWKLHEDDTLAWYHELHAGFRGRLPVTPANRTRFRGLEPGEKWVEV
jgi:hypothetical protein